MYISLKSCNCYKASSWKASGKGANAYVPGVLACLAVWLLTGQAIASNILENNITAASIKVDAGAANAASSSVKAEPRLNKAEQLAKEILASYGGEQKFKQVYEKGCHGFGKYTQISALSGAVNIFDIEIFNKGDKIREEMNVLGEPLIGGFDGKHSWLKQSGEVIEDNPAGRDQTRQEIEHGLQILLRFSSKNTHFELVEQTKNSADYDTLKVTTGDGISTIVYADKTTHLIARTEFVGVEDEQGLSVTKSFRYDDYRPYAGIMAPYKMSEFTGDKKVAETQLSSIKEELLCDTLFQVPKAGAPLLAKNGSVSVPFQIIGGEIIIDVTINGKSGYAFLVDTGATQTVIDATAAPLLGVTKQSDLSITTGAGSVPMSYMRLQSLGVGSLVFKEIPAVVADLSSLKKVSPDKNIVGMLGANIMRQFLVSFDFPNKTLTFAHPDNKIANYKTITVLPSKPSLGGSGILIEGVLDGKKIDCLIDTGAAYSLIPYELAKQIADKPIPAENVVHGLDGKPVKVADGNYKVLQLGAERVYFPGFMVAFEKTRTLGMLGNGSVAILGNPTWKHYCLTLDYKGQKVIITRTISVPKS